MAIMYTIHYYSGKYIYQLQNMNYLLFSVTIGARHSARQEESLWVMRDRSMSNWLQPNSSTAHLLRSSWSLSGSMTTTISHRQLEQLYNEVKTLQKVTKQGTIKAKEEIYQ